MAKASIPVVHHYTIGLLVLTASTGAIDAVSYLALDKVFTGNMTGNVLFLGFALMGVGGVPFLNNAIALLGFAAGAIVGARITGQSPPQGLPVSSRWILGAGAVLIVGLAGYWALVGTLSHPAMLVVTAVLAMIMGAQVAAVKPVGNIDVTTVVVTSTLANLARESRLAGGKGKNWWVRLSAIVAMGLGAVVGAGMVGMFGGAAALVASAVIFVAGALTLIFASRRNDTP